jgi:oligoendopeptidase F
MRQFKQRLERDIAALQEAAAQAGALRAEALPRWERVILAMEDAEARLGHLGAYVECLSAADAANEAYQGEEALLRRQAAELEKVEVDLLQGLKAAAEEDFAALLARQGLAGAEHRLRRLRRRARHTMSRSEEKLAAELGVDGLHAWGRLYNTISGKLEFPMRWPDGRVETLPISRWRALMSHADRAVGRAAFEGGNRAWATVADTCAAAINAIGGYRLTLQRHRGLDHYLDTALEQAQVERQTLEAMYQAIHENIALARRIFRVKARAMKRTGIAWFEREAPLPIQAAGEQSWEEGSRQVGASFRRAYPPLADYFAMALDKRWVESENRGGKRPGAFCTGSELTGEQRVYMTFAGALRDASTLAHEVGHAWHGWLMRGLRPMARSYPMTLAETASVFAEQIFAEGIARTAGISPAQQLLLLDGSLCDAAIMLLDITTRYEFERAFHDERRQGTVGVSRLQELMVQAQRRVWGEALLPDGEDPLFWASKLHFYITDVSFYNFPYTFGFLLAMALVRRFREQGPAFLPQYEEFLRATGSGSAEEVAQAALGEDIRRVEFWAGSIRALEEPLARYETLLEAGGGAQVPIAAR